MPTQDGGPLVQLVDEHEQEFVLGHFLFGHFLSQSVAENTS